MGQGTGSWDKGQGPLCQGDHAALPAWHGARAHRVRRQPERGCHAAAARRRARAPDGLHRGVLHRAPRTPPAGAACARQNLTPRTHTQHTRRCHRLGALVPLPAPNRSPHPQQPPEGNRTTHLLSDCLKICASTHASTRFSTCGIVGVRVAGRRNTGILVVRAGHKGEGRRGRESGRGLRASARQRPICPPPPHLLPHAALEHGVALADALRPALVDGRREALAVLLGCGPARGGSA
jgi:hypothetical protein